MSDTNFDLSNLKNQMPDYARDIKINLSNVLKPAGAPGLSEAQITGIALASAFATKNQTVITELLAAADGILSEEDVQGAKLAATLMAMNNIYYRYVHSVSRSEIGKLPANLRMQGIMKPGIDKVDFELYSLAVSAINGCGMCMNAHTEALVKHDLAPEAIQASIRIASVVHAAVQAVEIEAYS